MLQPYRKGVFQVNISEFRSAPFSLTAFGSKGIICSESRLAFGRDGGLVPGGLPKDRSTGGAVRRVLGIALLMALLAACGSRPVPVDLDAEEYAVYAAVIRAMYLPGPGQIVIGNRTGIFRVSDLDEALGWASEKMPGIAPETLDSFRQRNAEPMTLTDRLSLPVPYVLIGEQEVEEIFRDSQGWERFYERYPGSQGLMRLSRVGFNSDMSQALVYVGNQSDWLAGAGYFVLLVKEDGVWVVRVQVMLWIS